MRILVIEDEPDLQADIRKRLETEGYIVDSSGDGNEGLFFAKEYPLDAAIIDIGLPGISGIEIIQRLRDGHRGRCEPRDYLGHTNRSLTSVAKGRDLPDCLRS